MRLARRLCGIAVLCRCDRPHARGQGSPRSTPRAQPFLSIYFCSQANSIFHPGSGFCPLPLFPGW